MKMMATAVVYNRLHNSSVGMGGMGHHTQLARSLERILEEAHFSGELILTNRKLKDFPKTATKYDLTDTVIADLSRNRFCELPEEITTFSFLETLLLYHNSIRSIPESLKRLTSLTYLDLRSNQLSCLPREICFLPLHVLLVSNNRLTSLPDELGRMDRLTDLDISYNLLTALPARIGELRSLRSLSIRNNQLMYLPRELSCLTLVSLDVGNNRIASLPLEIRQMSSLVLLNLENNPLTSPPASLCVRGLVHVFKFLDTQATRDEKGSRAGGNYDGYTTLRRAPRHNTNGNTLEMPRAPRFHVESGFNTCDNHDKQRWSHDMPNGRSTAKNDIFVRKPSISSQSSQSTDILDTSLTSSTSTIVDDSINGDFSGGASPVEPEESHGVSNGFSPDKDEDELMIDHHQLNGKNGNEKANKDLGNIQTYKEYKEALKQQRNQEISCVYKAKGATQPDVAAASKAMEQGGNESVDMQTIKSTMPVLKPIIKNCNPSLTNGHNGYTNYAQLGAGDSVILPKKPIQKVIPSRNIELLGSQMGNNESTAETNKSLNSPSTQTFGDCMGYVKPSSPMKSLNANGNTNGLVTMPTNGSCATMLSNNNNKTALNGNSNKLSSAKSNRTVTWNRDIPSELLSFTMRREFDRQREETELMTQLRNIIETRLKMTLPDDIASALTDGVILCHLANYVRPRSVASIHVPSPGVSKLTMARCRRNVDNFLEACRKIGVDEELICSCLDVVPSCPNSPNPQTDNDNDTSPPFILPNLSAVLKTVSALIAMMEKPTTATVTATTTINYNQKLYAENQQKLNNNKNINSDDNDEIDCGMQKQGELMCEQQKQQQSTATGTKQQIVKENVIPLKSILKSHKNANHIIINNNNNNNNNDVEINKKYIGTPTSHHMPLHAHKTQNISSKYFYGNMSDKTMYNAKLQHNKCQSGENKQELPLRVNVDYSKQMTQTEVVDAIQEYKLLQLYANHEDTDQLENAIGGPPLVSKRIEFFEHSTSSSPATAAAAGNETVVKQMGSNKGKSSIFSIYRVADFAVSKSMEHNLDKEKEENVLLRHDSNVLTALLSIIFIGTFLLLIFFPLSG